MRGDDFRLLRLVPAVLRARAFRLYADGGGEKRRLVDLWQNGGAAALGHAPPRQLRELKNAAARGLLAPFPHFLEARLAKALSRIFPGRDIRLHASPPEGLEALAANGSAALWRAFLSTDAPLSVPESSPPVLIPVLPGVQGWRAAEGPHGKKLFLPLGLCALAIDAQKIEWLPPGDFLPPALLAVAARGACDIIAAAPSRARPSFPRVAKALRQDACPWYLRGIYLTPKRPFSGDEWEALFRKFLGAGFLLPPAPSQPAILPGELSPGEEVRLADLLREPPQA